MDEYENIPMVSQPINLRKQLHKHQLAMIYKMEKLEQEQLVQKNDYIQKTKLGINADISGYGKTLAMLGLILRDKMEWDISYPYVHEVTTTEFSGIITKTNITRYDRLSSNLILASRSVIGQWEDELSHTNLTFTTITTNRDVEKVDAEICDVVLVIPSMFNKYIITYGKYAWKRFIFDEPGHVKVPNMRELRAGFYWFVTASPNMISAKHRNCRNSFIQKIVGDGFSDFELQFDGMILKNNDDFVRASFNMPTTHYYVYECFNPLLRAINGIVNQDVIEMLECGDIEGAITALGGTKTKNIVELVRRNKQKDLETVIKGINSGYFKSQELIDLEKQREKINRQLSTLDKRFEEMLDSNCCICSEKMNGPVLEPQCQNLFCGNCLLTWLKTKHTCPLCREIIDTSKLVYLADQKDIQQLRGVTRSLTKNEYVINIINLKKDGKFLIFSSSDETFGPIYKLLSEHKISFTEVRGSVNTRKQIIEKFKNGKMKVLFLNSNYNGAGLNLQDATDLIFYHSMKPQIQNQIINRANRIGRKTELFVHELKVRMQA